MKRPNSWKFTARTRIGAVALTAGRGGGRIVATWPLAYGAVHAGGWSAPARAAHCRPSALSTPAAAARSATPRHRRQSLRR
ncbi:hypothetical protein K1T71_005335 [Dendrolimus kikuchii]|uniref:Uncharacterized protein n=1 Tax=Dendrolimus kikuchii TaxID=765133 RepID=A0ACC1D7P0_9NEOP|nr:hypothetical protein K1T71_005335 [Dendrolimus kikuchii]